MWAYASQIRNLMPVQLDYKCKLGTPEWSRTTNLLIRSQMLYPIELRVHGVHGGSRTHNLPLRRRTLYPVELRGRWKMVRMVRLELTRSQ
jgi:hypothetical protein